MERRPGTMLPAARSFTHERRDCPIQGCGQHRWPEGTNRRDLEMAAYTSRGRSSSSRSASAGTDAVAMEIVVSEMNSMVQRLANELEQQRTRSRLDGRQVIEDGKRRRRQLIGQVARYGMNSL